MFFYGGLRFPGMKNPAAKHIAMFDLRNDGVKIQYFGVTPVPRAIEALNTLAKGGTRRSFRKTTQRNTRRNTRRNK